MRLAIEVPRDTKPNTCSSGLSILSTTELNRIKKRLLELQEDKKAVKLVFDGASARLGLELSPPLREINLADFKKPAESPHFNSDLIKPVESQLFNSEASARLK